MKGDPVAYASCPFCGKTIMARPCLRTTVRGGRKTLTTRRAMRQAGTSHILICRPTLGPREQSLALDGMCETMVEVQSPPPKKEAPHLGQRRNGRPPFLTIYADAETVASVRQAAGGCGRMSEWVRSAIREKLEARA